MPRSASTRLEAWMRERFPAAGEVEFRWSGQVMETVDGLAFIGRNPLDADNVYVVTGDSGMGLTHGTIAGMLITDLIQGRTNRVGGALRSVAHTHRRRRRIRQGEPERRRAVRVLASRPATSRPIDEIAPGSGAVIREEPGRRSPCIRDERGELHRRSAVCPHLGCIVAWNPAASTWDCPCHGSRFDTYRHGRRTVRRRRICGRSSPGLEAVVIRSPALQELDSVTPAAPAPPGSRRADAGAAGRWRRSPRRRTAG